MKPRLRFGLCALCVSLALLLATSGCATVKRTAIRQLGDALASGGSTFGSDDDLELVRSAAPFSLKLMESLIAEAPDHRGLRLAAASGFTQYAYAFVQQEADEREADDFSAALRLRERARRLYLRARAHGLAGLDSTHADWTNALRSDPRGAVRKASRNDVPLLYWTGAAWAAAIALGKDNPELISELPQAEALIDRAFELDESFDRGALHSFLIAYEMSRASGGADAKDRARRHFERAVALANGRLAGPYVTLAESVAVPQQDRVAFTSLLHQALSIDPDRTPESRMANLTMQRRARWLLTRTDELFLTINASSP